jgi:hypothetical protein
MKKLFISLVLGFMLIGQAQASRVDDCMVDATVKSIGIAGLYGAGVMFVGSGLGVWIAPAGMYTAGQAAAVVGLNTFTGGMLGIGSGTVTHIVLNNEFDGDALRPACLRKAARQGFLGGLGKLMD